MDVGICASTGNAKPTANSEASENRFFHFTMSPLDLEDYLECCDDRPLTYGAWALDIAEALQRRGVEPAAYLEGLADPSAERNQPTILRRSQPIGPDSCVALQRPAVGKIIVEDVLGGEIVDSVGTGSAKCPEVL